jgi:membrane protein YdbS with pleckstrin-like domain
MGDPEYMVLFHAFYFFFTTPQPRQVLAEIPHAFNDVWRLWAIFCIMALCLVYAIGSIIGLVQNPPLPVQESMSMVSPVVYVVWQTLCHYLRV